jgi:hypothetical protein
MTTTNPMQQADACQEACALAAQFNKHAIQIRAVATKLDRYAEWTRQMLRNGVPSHRVLETAQSLDNAFRSSLIECDPRLVLAWNPCDDCSERPDE